MARQNTPAVSPYEYHRLNERFYRMAPHEYIDGRLRSLLLTISDTVDHEATWAQQVGYKDLKVGNVTDDRKTLDRYAAVESTVLLHHACETLLRLYLAHSFRTECPWLELSSVLSPAEFKRSIRALSDELIAPEREADILEVFSYVSDGAAFTEMPHEVWESHRKGLIRLVAFAIDEVDGVAHAYNAAKHGLALGAEELGLSIGPTGGDVLIEQDGPALNYLEMAGDRDDRRWQVTTRWVDPVRNIGVTFLVKERIRALWSVARWYRHLDEERAPFHPIQLEQVEALLDRGRKGFNLTSMSEHVARPEPDEERSRDEAWLGR